VPAIKLPSVKVRGRVLVADSRLSGARLNPIEPENVENICRTCRPPHDRNSRVAIKRQVAAISLPNKTQQKLDFACRWPDVRYTGIDRSTQNSRHNTGQGDAGQGDAGKGRGLLRSRATRRHNFDTLPNNRHLGRIRRRTPRLPRSAFDRSASDGQRVLAVHPDRHRFGTRVLPPPGEVHCLHPRQTKPQHARRHLRNSNYPGARRYIGVLLDARPELCRTSLATIGAEKLPPNRLSSDSTRTNNRGGGPPRGKASRSGHRNGPGGRNRELGSSQPSNEANPSRSRSPTAHAAQCRRKPLRATGAPLRS
jgi:hypothetical protein